MDCDDVMLALATDQTDQAGFHEHLDGCEDCRSLTVDQHTAWRWIARLPEDALDGDLAIALPTVDPVVFDIDQEIASGGMGRITKAIDRRLGREVAIKEVLDLSLRTRFEREAMITARLQHPAIVPVYEAGVFPNGHPFYTMRLVWGGTLGGAIERAKTMPARLALLPHVIAVTEALAYAHSHRIIHRDLKPGNVLVGEFGETVVIDWGLAKELGSIDLGEVAMRTSAPTLTRVGAVLGTPGFMSPEQASGGAIDERADVYALGAILYNLLAGSPPYYDTHGRDGSTKLIEIGLEQPPTPIAKAVPDAPADLRTIVEKAMARRKEDRYPSAQEMAQELRKFAAGKLIQREYSLRELIGRWIAKHRAAVSVGAIALVTLAAVIVLAFVSITSSRSAEREARQDAEHAQQEAIAQRDTVQRTAAELQENEGMRELRDGDGSRAYAYLAATVSDRTDLASRYLLTAAARDLDLEIDHHAATTAMGAPREVGKAIALAGDRVIIVDAVDRRLVIRRAGTVEHVHALGAEAIQQASFSPSGTIVALERVPAKLEIWDVSGIRKLTVPGLEPTRVVVDDRRVAAAAGKRLVVYDIATATSVLDVVVDDIRDLAIDDETIATCGKTGVAVWRFDALEREPARLAADCSLIAHLDAKQLVVVHNKYELRRWPIGAPAADKTMSGHIPINVLAVNRQKQRIATGDATGVVMWKWDGTALGESRDITGGIDKLMFTRDGTSFVGAGADDRVFVWDTESFHLEQAFGGKRGAITAIAIGEQAIASLAEYRVQVWKMPRGRLLERWKSLRFTIAGSRVITASPGELTAHSLSAPAGAQTAYQHAVGELVELRANARRLTARSLTGGIVTVDLTSNSAVTRTPPNTTSLSANPRYLLDVQATRVQVSDLESLRVRDFPADHASRAMLSPDGGQLAIVMPRKLAWIAVETAKPVQTIELPDGSYQGVFDAKGNALVLYGPHLPTLLVTATGSRTLTSDGATGAMWSGDGQRLAIGVSNTVQLWDLRDPKPRFTVSSTLRDSYALDHTGQLLATGSVDGSIRIWDERGRQIDRLVGSQQTITALAFAVDDELLIAQSEDTTVAVWDVHVSRRREVAKGPWKLEGAQLVPARP